MNQFLFKASDERFRHTVVPAIALSAHALDNISSSEKSSEFVACVLHSLVAVNMFSTEVIVANCLDHGRRKFFDIKASFTEECDYVLNEMQKVYRFDKETRAMTPKGRLEYHAEHGAPIMESLRLWMKDQIEGKKAEPNSPLGKAISYNLKRWKELTTFLRVEGAPLSNAEAERSIKWAICHRKNSLFYKTMNGAKQGDIIQSMIRTCNQAGINSFDYLVALQENRSKVYEAPEQWLL